MMIPGAYRLRNYRYAITAVLTNKCPAGPYRAPMLICSWVTEGTIDAVARALGLDPIEVRRRNMLSETDLPYTTATELTYRSVYPRETLERALAAFDYADRRREQAKARSAGRIAGIGVATYVEPKHVRLRLLQDGWHSRVGSRCRDRPHGAKRRRLGSDRRQSGARTSDHGRPGAG